MTDQKQYVWLVYTYHNEDPLGVYSNEAAADRRVDAEIGDNGRGVWWAKVEVMHD